MKNSKASTAVNIERRIRKHIHARPQTFEIEAPPGFLELCERFARRIVSEHPETEKSQCKVKDKNGRLQIENAPFELCHDLLLFGLPFTDVKILLHRGRCSSEEKLQAILDGIEWHLWIPTEANIVWDLRVDSLRSQLYNETRIKEQTLRTLKLKHKKNTSASPLHVGLDLHLERESLEILLSLGGRDYWQRGAKNDLKHAAPLREDLAACLVLRLSELYSDWQSEIRPPALVWNPFCGTGTLLHETALLLGRLGRVEGNKSSWCYPLLPFFKKTSFHYREKKAKALLSGENQNAQSVFFRGEEKSQALVDTTLTWLNEHGIPEHLHPRVEIVCRDSTLIDKDDAQLTTHNCIWLLANPPFGIRLSNASQGGTEKLYRDFAQRILEAGKVMMRSDKFLSGVVLCAHEETWQVLKKCLSGWRQRCEHFTLGGLDIRAFYFSNRIEKK
ncbi:MAG: hypothetical protein FJY29_09280 [Betaproteobacteria bacterium]|nr:hypothetical protein [Betaproteobacteria bacterium]